MTAARHRSETCATEQINETQSETCATEQINVSQRHGHVHPAAV